MPICLSCQSASVQRLQTAYETGTSFSQNRGSSVGLLGGSGIGVAATSSTGVMQTQLAQRCAPPRQKSLGGGGQLCFLAGCFLVLPGLLTPLSKGVVLTVIFGLVMTALPIALVFQNGKYNRQDWPALRAQWSQAWVCYQCGYMFVPHSQDTSPASRATVAEVQSERTAQHPTSHDPLELAAKKFLAGKLSRAEYEIVRASTKSTSRT
jgi:hypothetical protein